MKCFVLAFLPVIIDPWGLGSCPRRGRDGFSHSCHGHIRTGERCDPKSKNGWLPGPRTVWARLVSDVPSWSRIDCKGTCPHEINASRGAGPHERWGISQAVISFDSKSFFPGMNLPCFQVFILLEISMNLCRLAFPHLVKSKRISMRYRNFIEAVLADLRPLFWFDPPDPRGAKL